jgi:K+ transporter
VKEERIKLAKLRFFDAQSGRDIAVTCFMESQSPLILKLWNWNQSNTNKYIVYLALLVHIICSYFEPSSLEKLQEKGISSLLLALEFLCLLVELQDSLSKTYLTYISLNVEHAIDNLKHRFKFLVFLDIVIFLTFVNWILMARSNKLSFEYYIPLRILIIMFEVPEVRYAY